MCPCCEATLRVDPVTHAVIAHTAKPVARTFADMEAAARAMREGDVRKESIFRQSVEAEKNKSDVLEKKFAEAVKKAKEAPDMSKPQRSSRRALSCIHGPGLPRKSTGRR